MRTLEESIEYHVQRKVSDFEASFYKDWGVSRIYNPIQSKVQRAQFPVIDCIIHSISNNIENSVKKVKI